MQNVPFKRKARVVVVTNVTRVGAWLVQHELSVRVSLVTVSTRAYFGETTDFGRGEDLLCYAVDDSVGLFAI